MHTYCILVYYLTLILTLFGSFFTKKVVDCHANNFFKSKMPCEISQQTVFVFTFLISEFVGPQKNPPPPVLCRGWGSIGSFKPEAVRIRVNHVILYTD
jgi:hypothetical protein